MENLKIAHICFACCNEVGHRDVKEISDLEVRLAALCNGERVIAYLLDPKLFWTIEEFSGHILHGEN